MATRYCGRVKINCTLVPAPHMPHGEQYKCKLSMGSGIGSERGVQYVGLPAQLTQGRGIDAPSTVDDVASAALSFAVDDDMFSENDLSFNEDGSYVIERTAPGRRY